jgi:glycosyltransferase involved in cell wall biosynthesis
MTGISVAMATYNGARFLHEQLASLAAQTRLPLELVITDDGSEDDTLNIIAEFAKTAPFPVHIHRNEQRLGYKANFMKCASLCSGDLIAFADQDDIWLSQKLAIQSQHLACPEVLISCHNVVLMNRNGTEDMGEARQLVFRTGSYNYTEMVPFAYSYGFTQVVKRSLLNFDSHWAHSFPLAHDEYYFFLASVLGQVHYDETVMARYRQHDYNTSGEKHRKSFLELISDRFTRRSTNYELLVHNSVERLRILQGLLGDPKLPPSSEYRVHEAAHAYSRLCKCHERRLALYRGPTTIQRAIALFTICSARDYKLRPDPWHFTIAGFFKDVVAVFLPISATSQ